MKREMSKARQALVDSYIESLEKEILPWKQGWLQSKTIILLPKHNTEE